MNQNTPTGWREKDEYTLPEMRRLMSAAKIDAMLPWKSAHVAYLTNFWDAVHTPISYEEMATFLLVPLDRDPFIAGSHEHIAGRPQFGTAPGWLKNENRSGDWWGFDQNVAVFADQVKQRGLAHARIGYEKKWLPMPVFEKLKAALPDVTWVIADLIVPQVRLAKTPREQELMKHAVRGGYEAMEAYSLALRGGATRAEAELVRAKRALDSGCEWVGGATRMSWTGGTFETLPWWDAAAQQQFLREPIGRNWQQLPDEVPICVTHFETRYHYYFSDIAWHETLSPEPSPGDAIDWAADGQRGKFLWRDLCRDYEVIRAVQQEAINTIRIGMNQTEARAAVEAYLARNADYQHHGRGYFIHSLGLEVHEEPVLAAANPEAMPVDGPIIFVPGTVCSSEWFSRHWTVEDPYVLRADGKWGPLVPLRGLSPRE